MAVERSERVILVAGPTASGKSGFALALAERLGGVVINADSMQVYRGPRVLTARPGTAEEARAPHALYGFVPGSEAYSVGRYVADATRAIAQARAAGRVPIIVGGTGLYFKALLEGLSPVPAADPDVRAYWRAQAELRPAPHLHALLARKDGDMAARLMPTDTQRIVRALEVLETTGRSLAHWQRQPGTPVLSERQAVRLLLQPERAAHRAAIETRLGAMMQEGALEEVRVLLAQALDDTLPIMRALGVRPLAAHLQGKTSLEDAVAATLGETQAYAKRQRTWLRRHMIAWKAVRAQQTEQIDRSRLAFIDS